MYKAILGASIGVFLTFLNPLGVNARITQITEDEFLEKLTDSAANHICQALQQDIELNSQQFAEFIHQRVEDDLEQWVQEHPNALQLIMNLESSRSQIEEIFPELILTKSFKKCPKTWAQRAFSKGQ